MLLVGLCFIFRLREHQTFFYADFDFYSLFPNSRVKTYTFLQFTPFIILLKQAINIHSLEIHHIMLYKLSALS